VEEPGDRISNGQFAPGRKAKPRGKPFEKGHKKQGGRQKGTPNRASRAFKEWCRAVTERQDVQEAIEDRMLRGDSIAFFRAAEQGFGKAVENLTVDLNITGLEQRIKAGRDRLAKSK